MFSCNQHDIFASGISPLKQVYIEQILALLHWLPDGHLRWRFVRILFLLMRHFSSHNLRLNGLYNCI